MAKDWKQYWQELAKKTGLSEEDTQAVLAVLGKEAVSKTFSEGFVAVSEHHSTIDKAKQEWQAKQEAAEARALEWKKWYEEQGKPAYETNLRGINDLQKYRDLYGALDDSVAKGDKTKAASGDQMLTRKDIEELFKARDSAYVGLSKTMTTIALDHLNRFKVAPDMDALETFALEKGLPLDQAYKAFIEPKVEAARNAEVEVRIKAAREEGARDALSQHGLPDNVVQKPKGFSPIRDGYKLPEAGADPDRVSREAFMAGMNEAWEKPKP